jgi:NAD(P)-dependent dehydrogenase (short-subunit alcohol dehydrogenase family)
MDKFLTGKTALVTGASRGLGRAIAQNLAERGALVAINYASNEAAALETLALIEGAGGQGFIIQEMLGSYESAVALKAALDAGLTERTGGIGLDIVVNNAGGGVMANVEQTTPAILEKAIADNVTSTFYVTQVLMSQLRDGGRVITFSSLGAKQSLVQYAAYAICKSAVNSLTVVLAKELGHRQITVNCIMPGLVATDSNTDLRANPEMVRYMEDNIVLGRIGEPEELATVVSSLISPDMGYVTGQIIEVSGGLFL